MTQLPPSPFIIESAPVQVADEAVAPSPSILLSGAAAEPFTGSSTSTGGHQGPPAAEHLELPQAAGATDYIPELFSVFARRRCMPIVNPPLPQQCRREFKLDEAAFFDAILPPEPPPLFLRKPSQAFIRALFELAN